MKLRDARALARTITEEHGCTCTVPYGHGPDDYFARIWTNLNDELNHDPLTWVVGRTVDFRTPEEWRAWEDRCEQTRLAWEREKAARLAKRRRSPLDILIDRAVGRE